MGRRNPSIRVNCTSSAVISLPSWNLTPGLSLKVQESPSAAGCQLSAKPGVSLPLASTSVSQSHSGPTSPREALMEVRVGSMDSSPKFPAAYRRVLSAAWAGGPATNVRKAARTRN